MHISVTVLVVYPMIRDFNTHWLRNNALSAHNFQGNYLLDRTF